MYELKQGSARLVNALSCCIGDPQKIKALSAALNYLPEQLQQDIQALSDFHSQAELPGDSGQ